MRAILPFHITAGILGLVFGFVALYTAKGARVHRRSGVLFVWAMLPMSITGAIISAAKGGEGAVIAGVMTAYLVTTSWITVSRPARWSPRIDAALMLLALGVGLTSLTLGVEVVARLGGRSRDGLPAFPFFMFGTVGVLAGIGDARVRRAGIQGARRIARHLWRMTWALWIATSSFFLGQAQVFPKAIRTPAVLAVPVVLVLVTLLYWLWRVRVRGRLPSRDAGESIEHGSLAPRAV